MTHRIALGVLLCCSFVSCNRSLDSLEGPEHGRVSGLVCNKLPTLSAALEMPVSQSALISEGHCTNLPYSMEVDVIRTVMMPGEGKYSQFTIRLQGQELTMWVQTNRIT